eukprot:gene35691-45694_t
MTAAVSSAASMSTQAVATQAAPAVPHLLAHQVPLDLNAGDTAWMIVAT